MSSWKKILTEKDVKTNLNGSTDIVSNATVTSAVNLKANSVHTHSANDITDLIDRIYPVGAIYISANSANPSTLFGGTWVKIEDQFLLASANGQGVGQTDGYADATLVSHNHTQDSHTHTQNTHTHTLGSSKNFLTIASGDNWQYTSKRSMTTSSGSKYYPYASSTTGGIDQFSATNTTTATNNEETATNQYEGVDPTGKNLPPYLAVNIWRRTE